MCIGETPDCGITANIIYMNTRVLASQSELPSSTMPPKNLCLEICKQQQKHHHHHYPLNIIIVITTITI